MNVLDHILRHGSCAKFAPEFEPEPTEARPGSKAKIRALARRVLRGEALFVDEDPDSITETWE